MELPPGVVLFFFILLVAVERAVHRRPVSLANPLAGIPTECSLHFAWHNTVAAQRRILTVFPIYFLRLPAASGGLYAQHFLRGTRSSNHIYPRVGKSNLRFRG